MIPVRSKLVASYGSSIIHVNIYPFFYVFKYNKGLF